MEKLSETLGSSFAASVGFNVSAGAADQTYQLTDHYQWSCNKWNYISDLSEASVALKSGKGQRSFTHYLDSIHSTRKSYPQVENIQVSCQSSQEGTCLSLHPKVRLCNALRNDKDPLLDFTDLNYSRLNPQ